VSERGRTAISDTVVAQIAGMAAQEVDGVHMGGSAARAAGGVLSNITGSESQARGVSVEVGTVEATIDLTMGIEYGRNILRTVEEVRRRISERVQSLTGLRVTELNATISDIIFSEEGGKRRRALESGATTEVSPRSRTQVEGASGPLGYFVAVLQAVLVLGVLVALIAAFAAEIQWLGGLTEGSGQPETQIERTHPSTTAEGTRPTNENIEEETTTSITEPPPPPRPPPESPPTAPATAATAQYAQYATATATASPTATATAPATTATAQYAQYATATASPTATATAPP
jgi:uncharacterized alkaline shock family protein YloU